MAIQKHFRAILKTGDESSAYLEVPFDVKAIFGTSRPPVRVMLNEYEFRTTLAPYGGVHYVGVNQAARAAANVKVGDRVDVTVIADETPRTIKPPTARARWRQLSYTHQREYVKASEDAKKPETRTRRVEKTVEQLAEKSSIRS